MNTLEVPAETMHTGDGFELITGTSNPRLADRVGEILQQSIDQSIAIFHDGERKPAIGPSLRRKHAIIIQSPSPPLINDHLMEIFLMADAARRASAGEVTVVLPYFPYARQDRKDQPRVSISASLLANLLITSGANRIVTVDIHTEQAQGYIPLPWDNLYASYALVPALLGEIDTTNLAVVSPDMGGVKRATAYAKLIGTQHIAVVYKERDVNPNSASHALFSIGDVEGRDLLLTDDILASGGTLVDAAIMLKQKGAQRIIAAVAHGLFLQNALSKIENSPIEMVYVTDSIAHRPEVLLHPKVRVVTVAPLLAEAIRRIHTGEGLLSLLD